MFLPVFTHAAPTWICPTNTTFSGGNITGNFTEGYCTPEGEYCDGVSFTDDMSSILTDVSVVEHLIISASVEILNLY